MGHHGSGRYPGLLPGTCRDLWCGQPRDPIWHQNVWAVYGAQRLVGRWPQRRYYRRILLVAQANATGAICQTVIEWGSADAGDKLWNGIKMQVRAT